MALFQVSVLKNYLKLQDDQVIDKAYKKFTSYFQHPEIQENIRKSKEEQFQATFLNELFVKILGYTLNPHPSYNLTTEFKNDSNNRKADGAILKDEKAIGVIELKGTNTKHLEGIRRQAFDYKANQKNCVYVITSNFEKLRFYINDATEFLEFDLFELNREDFGLLWLCLHKENILGGLPQKIKEASLVEEEGITKEFYKDYSLFKRELFRDLVQRNVNRLKEGTPGYESDAPDMETEAEKEIKLNLFKKSQKLIDRFLFIFFAEDRGLLPPNAIVNILSEWNQLKDLDAEIPLYERFKQYFGYLNHGRQATETRPEIYAYNGGLFKPDELLDGLVIDDRLLSKHTSKLSKYDFESQVDVNILGHIFENSLNEIESVNAEIEGADFDKQKSKRKKDGVFYTPKYITKYIVENTIGRLCEEKKSELGFREEEYFKGRKRRQKDTLEALIKILDDYREWLLQLTICDPACGSGAFLNQALDFLIKEHRYIDEMKAKLLGGSLILSDIENTILERNIYGVDINEESVEIAKLSLWLRTAQPNRKLNDLSGNIKCGNSLIDDKEVAGEKAFKWEDEFPEVFDSSSGSGGGFDVVIGNPPYVSSREIPESHKVFFYSNYKTSQYRINLYTLFCELVFSLVHSTGKYSLIIPNYWLSTQWDSDLRVKLTQEHSCFEILNTYEVFEDVHVDTVIITGAYEKLNIKTHLCAIDSNLLKIENRWTAIANKKFTINRYEDLGKIDVRRQIVLGEDKWNSYKKTLGDVLVFTTGMQPYEVGKGNPVQTQEMRKNKVYHSPTKVDDTYLPLLGASNVQWMLIKPFAEYIKYGPNLSAMRDPLSFKGERILMNRILSRDKIDASLITEDDIINNSDVIVLRPKSQETNMFALLAIITSQYCAFSNKGRNINLQRKVYPKLNVGTLKEFPVPPINELQISNLAQKAKQILHCRAEQYYLIEKFLKMLIHSTGISNVTRKLQSWHELEFGDFIKELNKAIKASNKVRTKEGLSPVPELTKKDEFEWMELFEENRKKAVAHQQQIDETDRQIDQMVYELYGLTEEEIEIVENS